MPSDKMMPDDATQDGSTPVQQIGSPTAEPADPAEPAEPRTEAEFLAVAEPATIRRAPRYGPFIVTGAVVGLIIALAIVVILPSDSDESRWTAFGFTAALLIAVCALVGALTAVLLDGTRPRKRNNDAD